MKPKQIFAVVLIVFVAASLAYMIVKETTAKPSANMTADGMKPAEETGNDKLDTQIIVYYFYGDVRCATCHKLETYAKEALDTYFADELATGKIAWQAVNVEQPQNEHFIGDYELVTKSVILSRITEGKEVGWENLDRIWQEVGNKQGYLEYVRDSIAKFMEDTKS